MDFDTLLKNMYYANEFLDIIDIIDSKDLCKTNIQSDKSIIECDCKLMDDEEPKLIEE